LGANNLGALDVPRLQALGAALAGCRALQTIHLGDNNLDRLDNNHFDGLCVSLSACKLLFEIKGIDFLSAERQAALKKICDENRQSIEAAMLSLSTPNTKVPLLVKDLVFSYLTGQSQEEINKRRPSESAASSSNNSDNNNNNNNK
jgi:hypothetical protein